MPLFGRRREESPEMGGAGIPISQVLAMKSQGMNNNQIANQLRAQGYPLTQIRDAIAQADIKSAVAPGPEMGGMPPLPEMPDMMGMEGLPEMPSMEMPEMPPLPESGPFPSYPQAQSNMPMPPQMPRSFGAMPLPPAPTPEATAMGTEQLVNELQRVIEEIIEEKWKGVDEKISALDVWKTKIEDKMTSTDEKTSELNKRIDDFSKSVLGQTDEYQKTMSDVNSQMQAVEKIMGKLVPNLAEEIKELRNVVDDLKEK